MGAEHNWDDRRAKKASLLLRPAIDGRMGGCWADVGCGDGIFTQLLLDWLAPDSKIVSIDKDRRALQRLEKNLPSSKQEAVQILRADFTRPLDLPDQIAFDGILMANSLHFVRRKKPVLSELIKRLVLGGHLVIIEYNAERGNWAVPHPFSDETCLQLMEGVGLRDARIVTREPSSFLREIYTAIGVK